MPCLFDGGDDGRGAVTDCDYYCPGGFASGSSPLTFALRY